MVRPFAPSLFSSPRTCLYVVLPVYFVHPIEQTRRNVRRPFAYFRKHGSTTLQRTRILSPRNIPSVVPLTSYIRRLLFPLPLLRLSRFTFSKSRFIVSPSHFSDLVPRLRTFPAVPIHPVFLVLPSSSCTRLALTANGPFFSWPSAANDWPGRDLRLLRAHQKFHLNCWPVERRERDPVVSAVRVYSLLLLLKKILANRTAVRRITTANKIYLVAGRSSRFLFAAFPTLSTIRHLSNGIRWKLMWKLARYEYSTSAAYREAGNP